MIINSGLSRCRGLSSPKLWPVVIGGQMSDQIGGQVYEQKRYLNRNYDKPKRLLPQRIQYKYKDSKFFDAEKYRLEQPFVKPTDDEIVELTRVKLEKDYPDRHWTTVDINEEPFRQVMVGNQDEKGFTQVETIADKNRWFWVERLFPKNELPPMEPTDEPVVYPSGWRPAPKTKPDLPYFICRTRGRLLPVYRRYEIEDRNHETYWKNRWDSLINHWKKDIIKNLKTFYSQKWENNEKTITLTLVQQIRGDIWRLEEDLRGYLEVKHQKRILSAINEPNGVLRLKGDYVKDCVDWLMSKGF